MAHDIALELPDPPPSSSLEQRHVDNSTAHKAADLYWVNYTLPSQNNNGATTGRAQDLHMLGWTETGISGMQETHTPDNTACGTTHTFFLGKCLAPRRL